jgi:hypothetical protein
VKKTIFGVALVIGLLVQGLACAEQAPPPTAPATLPARAATAPAPKVTTPAPMTPCCECCGTMTCHGAWRERFWAWLCYQPIQRAGCCPCATSPCCHPSLYLYFVDHCKCGRGAPDRLPTKECGSCCHGAFLARLRGLFHGTGCATCR